MGTRVELYEAIRRDARREDLSIRALAERHGVHRRTVRAALASAVPAPRKVPVRVAPKLEAAKTLIDPDAGRGPDGVAQAAAHRSAGAGSAR